MHLHASCVARDGSAVLLSGPAGAGKSDLALRLIDRGFVLVADDQVIVEAGCARAPAALAGLIEVRGLGLLRLPYVGGVLLRLGVRLGEAERLPAPAWDELGLPLITVSMRAASAAMVVERALDCVLGPAPPIAAHPIALGAASLAAGAIG